MGYKEGSGLGKSEQGNTKVVDFNYQLGKRGFGLKLRNIEDTMEKWDFALEVILEYLHYIWCPFSFDIFKNGQKYMFLGCKCERKFYLVRQ